MKKSLSFIAAAAAVLSLASCTGKQAAAEATPETEPETIAVTETYTGVLPAADAEGIEYTLVLTYTGDDAGQYDMTQTYLVADTTAEAVVFTGTGDFTIGQDEATGRKYIKLAGKEASEDVYFVVATDSTITMADATLTTPDTPGMNYTLTATK